MKRKKQALITIGLCFLFSSLALARAGGDGVGGGAGGHARKPDWGRIFKPKPLPKASDSWEKILLDKRVEADLPQVHIGAPHATYFINYPHLCYIEGSDLLRTKEPLKYCVEQEDLGENQECTKHETDYLYTEVHYTKEVCVEWGESCTEWRTVEASYPLSLNAKVYEVYEADGGTNRHSFPLFNKTYQVPTCNQ